MSHDAMPKATPGPGCPFSAATPTDPAADAPSTGRLTYNSYLQVERLLELQQLESKPEAHDELLFITIHQAYELWFKQILFELEAVRSCMAREDVFEATRLMQRVLRIEQLLVNQIHVLESMTPRDFLEFRQALNPASGFQSIQFREVEFLTGMKDAAVMGHIELLPHERQRLEARLKDPCLGESLFAMLGRLGHPATFVPYGQELEGEAREETVQALLAIYGNPREHGYLYALCEALVEHDQNLLLWRFHHVRVVERLIGTKVGTGGSSGVDYLRSTLNKRAFGLLWEVRGLLSDEGIYGVPR